MNIILLPFRLIWALIDFFLTVLGKLLGAIIGLVLMAVGILLSVTFVAAFIGIPLFIIGFLMLLRSIF